MITSEAIITHSTMDTIFVVKINCSYRVLRFASLTKRIRTCCPTINRKQIKKNVNIPNPEEFKPPVKTEMRIIELSRRMANTITTDMRNSNETDNFSNNMFLFGRYDHTIDKLLNNTIDEGRMVTKCHRYI